MNIHKDQEDHYEQLLHLSKLIRPEAFIEKDPEKHAESNTFYEDIEGTLGRKLSDDERLHIKDPEKLEEIDIIG